MLLAKKEIEQMFHGVSSVWKEHAGYLSEIDSKFGDGDHGVTIGKMAGLIEKSLDTWKDQNIKAFFEKLGDDIMGIGGGSAGPLYGTMIGGMSEALTEETELDGKLLKRMLQTSLDAMRELTTADEGDKTMMDALIPAVRKADETEGDAEAILEAAMVAAKQGAEETKKFASRFGRMRSYKEQTIGTPDAGAVSTALFFQGLCHGLKTE